MESARTFFFFLKDIKVRVYLSYLFVLQFGKLFAEVVVFCLKLVKRDVKCIGSTVGITLVSYTAIHFINVALNNYCIANEIMNKSGEIIQVNYMYSIRPENPLLQLFYNMIPHSYWYMYCAVVVLVVLYLYLLKIDVYKFLQLLHFFQYFLLTIS